ncbi:MAG TPA: hypothetical protein VF529_15080 [Solirubrobacteraceae bacterium]
MTRLPVAAVLAALACAASAPAARAASGWSVAQQHGITATDTGEGPFIGTAGDMGARGDVVIASRFWDEEQGTWRGRVVHRVARGPWQGPQAPAALGFEGSPSVQVASDGFALVYGFTQDDLLALRSPSGQWRRVPAPTGAGRVIALSAGGRLAAAWTHHDDCASPPCAHHVYAAQRPPDGVWSSPQEIASGPDSFQQLALGADDAGGLVLAFVEHHDRGLFQGDDYRAWVATRDAAGAWSQPAELLPWGDWRLLTRLDVNERGDAALLLEKRLGPSQGDVLLARRPAGGAFGPPEVVVPGREEPWMGTLRVGRDGLATMVFSHLTPDYLSDPAGHVTLAAGGPTGPLETEHLPEPIGRFNRVASAVPLRDGVLVLGAQRTDDETNQGRMFAAVRAAAGGFTPIAPPTDEVGFVTPYLLLSDGDDEAIAFWEREDSYTWPTRVSSYTSVYGPLPAPPPADSGGDGDGDGEPVSPRPPAPPAAGGGPPRPAVPVDVGADRVRLRFPRGLHVGRRGVVRVRLLFDAPVSGRLRLADVFDRTLAKRTFSARPGLPLRLRLRVPAWLVRKLRRGRVAATISLRLTTPDGLELSARSPTTLRLG